MLVCRGRGLSGVVVVFVWGVGYCCDEQEVLVLEQSTIIGVGLGLVAAVS